MTQPAVDAPTFEHHREALGIGESAPRVSWVVTRAPDGWRQVRAELELELDGRRQTRMVDGVESVLVAWPFEALRSREGATVRVRAWGADGEASSWSPPAAVEAGLLEPSDWQAVAIGPAWDEDPGSLRRPALLRSEFHLGSPAVSARLYVTAHGLYQAEINGIRVGDDELGPGWTSYHHRLRCYTYDVTGLLREGPNAIGAHLADGWFRGRLGFGGGHVNLYGEATALLAQLEVTHPDGSRTVVATGPGWQAAPGPVQWAGLLEGETYDARDEIPGWSEAGFTGAGWTPVAKRDLDVDRIAAPTGPPVRCTQEIAPVNARRTDDGRVILDFGQNLVGRLRLDVAGQAGETIQIRHAEVLDQAGELCTRPLRGAVSTDRYVLKGGDRQTWEPRFTIHGFRYAEITGWGDRPVDGGIVARVLHTDMRRTGWFECSDPMLSSLHENVVWSMRGNFVDLPTDCPQRDERLGWTGDIQVFAPTASFLYDCSGVLTSWLQDVAAEQLPDGTVPWYVPTIPGGDQWTPPRPGAGWGDAATLVPWTVFEHFGDTEVLRRQWPSARAWNDLEHELAGDDHVWDTSYQLGDWLDPTAPPDDPADGLTDPHLVATAYYARSSAVLAATAAELGRAESDELAVRAAQARDGFRGRYRTGPGRLTSDSQAAYAIAIMFGLFEPEEEPAAGQRLAELVREADVHLTTGFLGTPVLLDALTRTGHLDLAVELILQRSAPSWLYPVTMGATTIWERWDSMLPDGDVNPGDMTSFNHYALGAVADWMHRTIAGIAPTSPGWRAIRFRPGAESGLDWAGAAHETPYGRASIVWSSTGSALEVEVRVPAGATGVLEHPAGDVEELSSGLHRRSWPNSR
ncbi:alpha-L-rhamnosidase [Promicromonospora sp. AC04]|uniref:alpha-L-rhamnosidase n=1 Tax=Promicromonospora sp. AC04 TaxID=2135723 RepID=UPI000D3C504B|nr:alpha-L-rhamnosidase [Promicromonospora sp. AC04]PUB27679.1 alpha-L-rhamnosidase [Promicromonospora sp. AC04]